MSAASPAAVAARIRAAEAYAGFTHEQLGAAIGLNKATVARITSSSDFRTADLEERQRIADACSVPREFMEEGFARYEDEQTLAERVAALEAEVFNQAAGDLAGSLDADGEAATPSSIPEGRQP